MVIPCHVLGISLPSHARCEVAIGSFELVNVSWVDSYQLMSYTSGIHKDSKAQGAKYSRVFDCGLAGERFVAESAGVWSKWFGLGFWCCLRIHVAMIDVCLPRAVLDMPSRL